MCLGILVGGNLWEYSYFYIFNLYCEDYFLFYMENNFLILGISIALKVHATIITQQNMYSFCASDSSLQFYTYVLIFWIIIIEATVIWIQKYFKLRKSLFSLLYFYQFVGNYKLLKSYKTIKIYTFFVRQNLRYNFIFINQHFKPTI